MPIRDSPIFLKFVCQKGRHTRIIHAGLLGYVVFEKVFDTVANRSAIQRAGSLKQL